MTPETPEERAPTRIEVCEKHGLRYNAAIDDGCARCRTEAGSRAIGGAAFSARRSPELMPSLLVAATLVAAVGGSLYGAHSIAYRIGRSMVEGTFEPSLEEPATESAEEHPERAPYGDEEELDAVFDELIGDG